MALVHGIKPIVTSGLVLCLDAANRKSYPTTGTTWTDLSGNGNHATLFNTPIWSNTNGGTFTFDSTSDYAEVPDGFANFTSGITVFAFVNMGAANSWERIIDFGGPAEGQNSILFARSGTSNTLIFQFIGISGNPSISATNGIVNNTIACYAGTANGTTGALYRNGVSILSQSFTSLPPNATRTNCWIGRSNFYQDPYFQGTMHLILIYNRALSATEIAQNYNALKGRYGLS
jgi:hypothetical protein